MLIYINNKRMMRISQERVDGEIAVTTADKYPPSSPSDTLLIPPGDFVMLVNLYKHIKSNDIRNDFINPYGKNKED